MTRSTFPCTQCGLCCRNVHLAEQTRSLDRGDGVCRHYGEADRRCSIYDIRPEICRVDGQYELHYSERYTWDAFVAVNVEACRVLERLDAAVE